jgi:hypothetical protein
MSDIKIATKIQEYDTGEPRYMPDGNGYAKMTDYELDPPLVVGDSPVEHKTVYVLQVFNKQTGQWATTLGHIRNQPDDVYQIESYPGKIEPDEVMKCHGYMVAMLNTGKAQIQLGG